MTFDEQMRALMNGRGISLRQLAKLVCFDAAYLSRVLNGRQVPSENLAESLDDALGADGKLACLRPPSRSMWRIPGITPDDEERLVLAAKNPARVDLAVVESLASVLAHQRRLDDTAGPAAILQATRAQTNVVTQMLHEARGVPRQALSPVAAEWVQFSGWLLAELRQDHAAVQWLTDAEDLADDIGDGTLAAQAANFKGYLARQQGRPRGVIRHFLTAFHTPGARPAQRLGDAIQAAQGYALIGEHTTARGLLTEAAALEDTAARELPPGTAYWLTPDFQHINIGLALAGLGENAAAAEHLTAGLDTLPQDQREAEWTREYRAALDLAHGEGGQG